MSHKQTQRDPPTGNGDSPDSQVGVLNTTHVNTEAKQVAQAANLGPTSATVKMPPRDGISEVKAVSARKQNVSARDSFVGSGILSTPGAAPFGAGPPKNTTVSNRVRIRYR